MNDHLPPPLTDDDLSAHLDGEGPPELAAQVEADPAARARLEQLRAAAQSVGDATVSPLGPAQVDELIARALAADPAGSGAEAEPATVVPLRSRRGGPSWLVAAVVLVLMAAGLGLVWSGTHGGGSDQTASSGGAASERAATSADQADPEVAADNAGSGSSDGTDTAASPTTAAAGLAYDGAPLPDLGTFDTPEALRSSLATGFPDTGTAASSSTPNTIPQVSVDRCAGLLVEVLPVTGDPTRTGFAQVAGKTVLVYEFVGAPDDTSTTTVPGTAANTITTAVNPEACDPLFVFQR